MMRYIIGIIWIAISICSCINDALNDERSFIPIERFPDNLDSISSRGFDWVYKIALKTDHSITDIEFSFVHYDSDRNGSYFDKGVDLITIAPREIDTLSMQYIDTLRDFNYFLMNGQLLTVRGDSILSHEYTGKLPNHLPFKGGNIFFNRLDSFNYYNFEDSLLTYNTKEYDYTYLYFWSPKCSPCISTMEMFDTYVNQNRIKINIVALADPKFGKAASTFVKDRNLNFETGIASQSVFDYTGTEVNPKGYLIDRDGHLIGEDVGLRALMNLK